MENRESYALLRSQAGVDATADALARALADAGNKIFARIDQAAEAVAVGLKLRPTVLLVFGNPRVGTNLMDAVPALALDLPMKIVVWQDRSETFVGFNLLRTLAARFGTNAVDESLAAIDRTVRGLIEKALAGLAPAAALSDS